MPQEKRLWGKPFIWPHQPLRMELGGCGFRAVGCCRSTKSFGIERYSKRFGKICSTTSIRTRKLLSTSRTHRRANTEFVSFMIVLKRKRSRVPEPRRLHRFSHLCSNEQGQATLEL